MSDKPPARVMTPGEVRGELAFEWARDAVRRGHVRLRSPRLAELLDQLAVTSNQPLEPIGAPDRDES